MSAQTRVRAASAAALLASLLASCGEAPPQKAEAPPPAVTVAKPVKKTVTDYDEYVGRFVAVNTVEVRARVSGYLETVHFEDGQMVKEGDPLFTIDRRPFQIAVDQARANLDQAKANLAFAQADLDRASQLVREHTISEQVFQQRTQAKRTAAAAVAAQDAAVRQAELELNFTLLNAPIAGRIGDRKVSPGNLVTGGASGNTTLLATIVSTDPIRFEFTFDEASYLRYERTAATFANGDGVPVALKLIDEEDFGHKGRFNFVNNVIDRSTGTIRGRAEFANPKGLFTPGMFGRLQVPASPPYEAIMVPDVAIGSEQVRKFVLAVDGENVVRQKYVTLGALHEGLRVVKDGLDGDERIIVNGLMRARPGQKVTPQEQGADGAKQVKK